MEKISKELLNEFVKSQHFTSTTDIMVSMKEVFSDLLQTVMDDELKEKLGFDKSERVLDKAENDMSKNYKNGYSKKPPIVILNDQRLFCNKFDYLSIPWTTFGQLFYEKLLKLTKRDLN